MKKNGTHKELKQKIKKLKKTAVTYKQAKNIFSVIASVLELDYEESDIDEEFLDDDGMVTE